MGITLLVIVFIYLFLGTIVLCAVNRFTKSKKKLLLVGMLLLFGPFWRPLICSFLFLFYQMQPLQQIHQIVELPISVYWQDNVWPGFDEYSRNWMIDQYLDGVHLKVLALNGEDKKIYLYRAEEQDFVESRKALAILKQRKAEEDEFRKKSEGRYKETYEENCQKIERDKCGEYITAMFVNPRVAAWQGYDRIKKETIKRITDRAEIFNSPEKLPTVRYRVDFKTVETSFPTTRLLHADEITITDLDKNTVIAFSRRYMAYGNWLSQLGGANPDFHQILGDKFAYAFDDKVLFGSIDSRGSRQGRDGSLLEILSIYFQYIRRY
jgi:hypothetical protein